jgi:hypothetical protein
MSCAMNHERRMRRQTRHQMLTGVDGGRIIDKPQLRRLSARLRSHSLRQCHVSQTCNVTMSQPHQVASHRYFENGHRLLGGGFALHRIRDVLEPVSRHHRRCNVRVQQAGYPHAASPVQSLHHEGIYRVGSARVQSDCRSTFPRLGGTERRARRPRFARRQRIVMMISTTGTNVVRTMTAVVDSP